MPHSQQKHQNTAAIIIIGNEILSGRTHDTNMHWLAGRLTQKGINLIEVRTIRDLKEEITDAITVLKDKADYVFTTGGIGPTHDDTTTACIAQAFGLELEENAEALKVLQEKYGADDLNEGHLKMAQIPVGAELIHNPVSAGPGFRLNNVFVLSGMPKIMHAMFNNISKGLSAGTAISCTTVTCHLEENIIAGPLTALQTQYPDVYIGSYPESRNGVTGVSLVLKSMDNNHISECTDKIVDILTALGDKPRVVSIG